MKKRQFAKDNNLKFDFTLSSNSSSLQKAVDKLIVLLKCEDKHIDRHKRYLSLILSNLVIAYKQGNQFRVTYPRGKSFYSSDGFRNNGRLNPHGISLKLLSYIEMLQRHKFLSLTNGFYDWSLKGKSFNARMQLTEKFVDEIITPYGLYAEALQSRQVKSALIIRADSGMHIKSSSYKEMAERVCAYNRCYDNALIGIQDHRHACVVFPEGKHLHRVFNHDSLEKGGRFYGGWWQQKGEDERAEIIIDGQHTIELDYSGAHIGLLYGCQGMEMPALLAQDPYRINELPRDLLKLCVLRSLNNPSPGRAWCSVNHELYLQGKCAIARGEYDALMEAFFIQHPSIKNQFFKEDLSLTLQNLDSVVADSVMEELMLRQGIIVLPIHDSFIVTKDNKEALCRAMVKAYKDSNDPRLKLGFTSIRDREKRIVHVG